MNITKEQWIQIATLVLVCVLGILQVFGLEIPVGPAVETVSPQAVRERIAFDAQSDSYLFNAADLYVYSDDHTTQKFHVDGATGAVDAESTADFAGAVTFSGGHMLLTEAASAADAITAAECGKTFFVSGDDYTLTLPAVSTVSTGCEFRFIVAGAPTTSTVVLTGNTDEDVLIGGINELEVDTSDDGPYDASADTITFTGGTAVVGDFVYMISNGTMFYVSGQANADGGITITDSD